MTVAAVLTAAADEVERWPQHHADRELRNGAGGAIFCLLFETAKQMYGWTAIQHLQKHLTGHLPHGQIQHWRETDRAAVVEALRAAAKEPAAVDAEAQSMRSSLGDFRRELCDAVGWLTYDVATLVREVGNEMGRLRRENARLTAELEDARRR